jgi:hypothetical protein
MNLTITSDGTYGFGADGAGTKLTLPSGAIEQVTQLVFDASPLGVRLVVLTDSERYVLSGTVTLSGEFAAVPA